jgi:putative DNA primase/helicase
VSGNEKPGGGRLTPEEMKLAMQAGRRSEFVDLSHPDAGRVILESGLLDAPTGTGENSPARRVVAAPTDPMAVARQFVAEEYTGLGGALLLRHHRNTFHRYLGDHWPADDEERVKSELWQWLEHAAYEKVLKDKTVPAAWEPNRHKIANVLEALKAIGHVAQDVQPPVWLNGSKVTAIEPGEFVPLANGILEFRTRVLIPHRPDFFELHVLPFGYDPDAPPPTRWFKFLDDLWRNDEESKQALQEWFGYSLANATDLQKMFLLVGPKRSGKGTIGRVLRGLLGHHNVAGPTLSGLSGNFGLQALIGKPLAVISDARLGARSDNLIAVERLLSISGEDTMTVDRKFLEPWTGRLPTRFLILSNELPQFTDASGALASRFVTSVLTESFYGRENPALTRELLQEASGILNWALEGLDRLRKRGYFVTPESAREAQRHLEDLSSPVGAFIRDRCITKKTGPEDLIVSKSALWTAWKEWSADEGLGVGTKANLLKDIYAAVPGARATKPRADDDGEGERVPSVTGLALQPVRPTVDRSPDHPDQGNAGPGAGPSTDRQETAQPSGRSGWSGDRPIVGPTGSDSAVGPTVANSPDHLDRQDSDDADEVERLADLGRELGLFDDTEPDEREEAQP